MSASSLDSSLRDRPLAEALSAATRPLHSELNKLILSRLPLALPPRATSPSLYLSGLLHIAPIYIAFEDLWRDIIEQHLDAPGETSPVDASEKVAEPLASDRVRSVLASLHVPGLARSDRLRADIASLTGSSPQAVEKRLRSAARTGHFAAFVDHIRRVGSRKPHVIVAYTYIFFMALFAGGRFLRTTLESAARPFWDSRPPSTEPSLAALEHGPAPVVPTEHHGHHHSQHRQHRRQHDHESIRDEISIAASEPPSLAPMPLRFLHFNTPADGEDLKCEYKLKLSESEALLTHGEKMDIVQEGVCIFQNMILLVHQLDAFCATQQTCAAERAQYPWSLAGLVKNAHAAGGRFRDSIAVTRQRWERSSAKEPPADDDDGAEPGDAKTAMERGAGPGSCPSSKSVRFDGPATHSAGPLRGSAAGPAPGQMHGAQVAKWLLATVLGVLTLGVFFTGRRNILEWSRA